MGRIEKSTCRILLPSHLKNACSLFVNIVKAVGRTLLKKKKWVYGSGNRGK